MKVQFRQGASGGCSLYAMAHITQEPRLLDYIVEGEGHNVFEVNEALSKAGLPHYIETFWMLNAGLRPNRLTNPDILKLDPWTNPAEAVVPIHVSVWRKKAQRCHALAVFISLNTGGVFVVDSYNEEVETMTREEFFKKYWVVSVEYIGLRDHKLDSKKVLAFGRSFFKCLNDEL